MRASDIDWFRAAVEADHFDSLTHELRQALPTFRQHTADQSPLKTCGHFPSNLNPVPCPMFLRNVDLNQGASSDPTEIGATPKIDLKIADDGTHIVMQDHDPVASGMGLDEAENLVAFLRVASWVKRTRALPDAVRNLGDLTTRPVAQAFQDR